MSQLLNKLEKISRGSPAPMGFGAASRVEKNPAMALIGNLSRNHAQGANRLSHLEADGALLHGLDDQDALSQITGALNGVPWGVRVDELDQPRAQTLLDSGCDFFVVSPEKASVEAMKDDRAAYLIDLPADAGERFLRAIEDLPVDALLLSLDPFQSPLTLQDLISITSVRSMFDKYLIIHAAAALTSKEIECLRDVGVDGLMVDAGRTTEKELKDLKQRLFDIPKQRRPRSERMTAVLPRVGFHNAEADEFDDDDDEE